MQNGNEQTSNKQEWTIVIIKVAKLLKNLTKRE